jgi:hypothetical protein
LAIATGCAKCRFVLQAGRHRVYKAGRAAIGGALLALATFAAITTFATLHAITPLTAFAAFSTRRAGWALIAAFAHGCTGYTRCTG